MATLSLYIKAEGEAAPADAAPPAEGEQPPAEAGEKGGAEGEKKPVEMIGKCVKPLLEAYDIQSGWETVEDQNLLCPSVTKMNCCSYHAQLDIFRKWVLKGEKDKILKTYR